MPAQVYRLVEVGLDAGQDPGGGFRMFAGLPDVLNVKQAARALGASECWLREAIARGEVGSFRVGRLIKVPKTALLEFIERGGCDG